jgi:hypothetical protein
MKYLLALSVVLALLLSGLVTVFILANSFGWNAQLYCQAAALDRAGENPYLAQNFPGGLPWLYPPALLNILAGLCASPLHFAASFPVIYLAITLLSLFAWQPGKDWLLALALAVSALAGLAWSLWTGNLEIFLLLPVSLAFRDVRRARWQAAAFWLGIVAAIKIVPLVYLVLLLLAPLSGRQRLRLLAVGAGSFLLAWSLLSLSRPDLLPSYLLQLSGRLPGQENPAAEFGSINHPAFPFLFVTLFGWPNDLSGWLFGLFVGGLLAIGLFGLAWRCFAPRLQATDRQVFFFSFGFLLLSLVMPHFKPYTFLLLAPALFELLRPLSARWKSILLFVASFPLMAFYVYHWLGLRSTLWWAIYSQPLALLACILLILVAEWRRLSPLRPYARTP